MQVKYYTSAGHRATSDGVIPVKPNSSVRFTGRTNILAKLKEHFTAERNDKLHRKFFLLYGMGGIGKTQICLRFIEEMSGWLVPQHTAQSLSLIHPPAFLMFSGLMHLQLIQSHKD